MVSIANSNVTLPMSYEDNSSILSLAQSKARKWRDLRPLEKILVFIIGLVSIISLALIIAVACLGAKLSKVEQSMVTAQQPKHGMLTNGSSTIDPGHHRTTDAHNSHTTSPMSHDNHDHSHDYGPSKTSPGTGHTNVPCASSNHVCLDAECTLAAGELLRGMDLSVDPCRNFYAFSCGNWGEANPMPDSYSRWDQFESLEERMVRQLHAILEDEEDEDADPEPVLMARKFYDNCKNQHNENNYTSLRNFLDHLLEGFDKNVGKVLGHVRRVLGGNFLFALYVGVDERHPAKNTIYLDQPSFGVPRTQLLDSIDHHNDLVEDYELLIDEIWHRVFADGREAEAAANAVHVERLLAQIATGPLNRTNKADLYNPYTVEHLHQMTKAPAISISWDSYFDEVFFDIYHPEDDHSKWNHSTIIVRDVHFFNRLDSVLTTNHSVVMLRDFITWKIIMTLVNDVSHELRQLMFDLDEDLDGVLAVDPLWKTCVRQTNEYFGMALSYHYVQEYFDEDYEHDIRIMIDDIKKSLRRVLNSDRELDWMTRATKKRALEKLDKVTELVGHPDWLVYGSNYTNKHLLTTELMDYYYHLNLDKHNDHFDNVLDVLEWKSRETLKELKKPRDNSKWKIDPTTIAAHYFPTLNSIILPAGLLQNPIFGAPLKYLNYGALGSIIAHMLTHVVDHKGSQYGAEGTLHSWWDAETQKNYLARTACFTGHFTSFITQNMSYPIHWKMSLAEESIADNIGLKLAYRAYQDHWRMNGEEQKLPGFNETANQLFFLAYSQLWCSDYRLQDLKSDIKSGSYTPAKFRSQGGLQNSVDFQRAWSCPPSPSFGSSCNIL